MSVDSASDRQDISDHYEGWVEELDRVLLALSAQVSSATRESIDGIKQSVAIVCRFLEVSSISESAIFRHDMANKLQILKGYADEFDVLAIRITERDILVKLINACNELHTIFKRVRQSLEQPNACEFVNISISLRETLKDCLQGDTLVEGQWTVGEPSYSHEKGTWNYKVVRESSGSQYTELELDLEKDIEVWTHSGLILQAVLNIVKNSYLHNQELSYISIQVHLMRDKEADSAVIRISDNGKGIEDPSSVFNSGYTTGGESHSGLGLAELPEKLQAVGASITCRNIDESGREAEFTITLPTHQPSQ